MRLLKEVATVAVLKSGDGKELIVSCRCGCDEGIHIKIDESYEDFAYQAFTNGNFYKEQYGAFGILKVKFKKIWAIIRNKDYYYSDIVMSREDFHEFKKWINQFGGN